jgi:NCS1 family nucleobase:cation symporter-1
MGGADVSWMVGLVATALTYYLLASNDSARSRCATPAGARAGEASH